MSPSTTGQTQGKAKVIKANYDLQNKVGKGGIETDVVQKSQKLIDTNDVDFAPTALLILQKLQTALDEAKNPARNFEELRGMFTRPVMELKANAATFHYDLVGSMAAVMLGFLENIKIMDRDAIEIVRAHHASLQAIVNRKLSGDGGDVGQALVKELQNACQRYYSKQFGK